MEKNKRTSYRIDRINESITTLKGTAALLGAVLVEANSTFSTEDTGEAFTLFKKELGRIHTELETVSSVLYEKGD